MTRAPLDLPQLDIPEFEIGQQISSGGFLEVYSGVRQSDNLPVVVKCLKPKYAEKTSLKNRLADGYRWQGKIKHANVVSLLKLGFLGEAPNERFYAIEPTMVGGTLLDRLDRGLSLQKLLKDIKDLARAVDQIHIAGAVHCDIKPENILYSGSDTPMLADFGAAHRLGDPLAPPFIGSPEYRAPELTISREVGPASDLYSLVCVLYRALTGAIPYSADTSVGIAMKHLQEPIPRLPQPLDVFQPVLDKGLAKKPTSRFASGAELVNAIDSVRAQPNVPIMHVRSAPIESRELGDLMGEQLTTAMDPTRQERAAFRNRKRRRNRVALAGIAVLALIGVGAYYNNEQGLFSVDELLTRVGITEDPEVAAAWGQAQALRQDPNQSLATIVSAYRRVITMAPDHLDAKTELSNLASEWETGIESSLQSNNLEAASTRLTEAAAVFPDDRRWAALDAQLFDRQRAERILTSTRLLLSSHGLSDLPSATAAIQAFEEVLRLAPDHPEARAGLTELAQHYAQLAATAVNEGRLNEGISLLERATAADRSVAQLDDVRRLISQATTARAAIDDLLQQARRLRADGQLMAPPGENAAELYHRVLATDPDNAIAIQGLDEITSQVAANVEELLEDGALAEVEALVGQATAANLEQAGVTEMRRRLDAARSREQAIFDNLASARSLIDQGYLTEPPAENAVAKLREVQQFDPNNLEATAQLKRVAERLATVAVEAREYGLSEDAKQYLDLALAITPEVGQWVALRESWEAEE